MSRFDFTLKHVSGVKMGKADSLSRRLDWKVGVEKDNEDQVFIKNHWIHNLSEVVIEGPEVNILEKIKKARGKDKEVVRCYDSRLKGFKSRNNSCIGVTQENSIEFLIQSSLPYILFPMVCASYCAPYPK